jgi:hypothetical protein
VIDACLASVRPIEFKLQYCKLLPNKDHATCRKERFTGSIDCRPVSQVQNEAAQLEWVVGFIGGATL